LVSSALASEALDKAEQILDSRQDIPLPHTGGENAGDGQWETSI